MGAASTLSMSAASAAAVSPKEPLIVTQLADPDPYFGAGADPRNRTSGANRTSDEDARIDEAMRDFGRAIDSATSVEQQQLEAKCREGEPDKATREQRFAWAASCRYNRY